MIKFETNRLFKILTIFTIVGGLLFALRGKIGQPNVDQLLTKSWQENGPFELSPEKGRFALTYSLIENHSVIFTPQLGRFVTPDLGYKNGKYVSLFAPGVSVLTAPGYLLGSLFGAPQLGTYFVVTLFAIGNTYLLYKLARLFNLGLYPSLIGALTFLFATPAYAYAVNLYQHHISTFLILLALNLAFTARHWFSVTMIWFLCAMSIPIDYPNLFLMMPIGIYSLKYLYSFPSNHKFIKINWMRTLSLLSVLVPLSLFMWFNYASYDNPFQLSGTVASVGRIDESGLPASPEDKIATPDEQVFANPENQKKSALNFFKTRNLINGFYTHLLSLDRGILSFTPIIFFTLFGFRYLFKKNSSYTVVIVSVAISALLLYSLWGDPWGGWAFGSRYMIPAFAMCSLASAAIINNFNRSKIVHFLFATLVIGSVFINTTGALGTIATPPQVQVLYLESITHKRERYSWDRSLESIQNGSTKSFLYNSYFHQGVTPFQYYLILSSVISLTLVLLLFANLFSKNGKVSK
ncbi:hypothetical protein KBD75_04980 [Candidatus Woesebacteria bacterium]|nr:hypothetical protein [Candidatus Woesebacteria bacterium]